MPGDALTPVPPEKRTLTGLDVGALWFGAAIVISECWAGGLPPLANLGLAAGLVAILLGRLIGNGLMGAMAAVGARTGLPTMVLTRPSFGERGSLLPAFFNVAQLIGWTAWMYFVAFLYCDQLAGSLGLPSAAEQPAMLWVWIGLLAVLCTLCSFVGAETWHRVLKWVGGAMVLLTIWMTGLVVSKFGLAELFDKPAPGGSLLAGTDLVVAMSVSWLPLVADYSRFARSVRGGGWGTFLGYLLGGSWMYFVGLLVAVAVGAGASSPDQIVVKTMSEAGLLPVFLGLSLVLVSTVTTTFLDIYSGVVSAQNIVPKLPIKPAVVVFGLGSAALAGLLDVFQFEKFLLAIGAVFLPIFTVVLLDHWLARGQDRPPAAFRGRAVVAWAVGFVIFDWAKGWATLSTIGLLKPGTPWSTGASLPTIAVTAAAFLALHPAVLCKTSKKVWTN